MKNVVNWGWNPRGDESFYHNTGEGGLFAYATWALEDYKPECHIDVYSNINFGDVRIASVGPDKNLFQEQTDEYTALSNSGKPLDEVCTEIESNVVPVMVTVFLGSTFASLFSDVTGEYFYVTEDSLTEDGLALIKALEAVYGAPATYTTYLDT